MELDNFFEFQPNLPNFGYLGMKASIWRRDEKIILNTHRNEMCD